MKEKMTIIFARVIVGLMLFGSAAAFSHLASPFPYWQPTTLGPSRQSVGSGHAKFVGTTQLAMVGRLFRRRNRKGVQTLEREETPAQKTKNKPAQKPMWRVMLHNTEWQPDVVARILAKVIPVLDKRAAFELCTHARFAGRVALVIAPQKQAETYCLGLQRYGLPVTIEPHDVER